MGLKERYHADCIPYNPNKYYGFYGNEKWHGSEIRHKRRLVIRILLRIISDAQYARLQLRHEQHPSLRK